VDDLQTWGFGQFEEMAGATVHVGVMRSSRQQILRFRDPLGQFTLCTTMTKQQDAYLRAENTAGQETHESLWKQATI
jgi:hypothetical protein